MKRTISYPIDANTANRKIASFLKSKGYSAQNLTDLKKNPDAVKLDGVPARLNTVVHEGEVLTISIAEEENSDQIRPVPIPVEIVYEDEDLLVVNKPAGMPIHPSHGNAENSL